MKIKTDSLGKKACLSNFPFRRNTRKKIQSKVQTVKSGLSVSPKIRISKGFTGMTHRNKKSDGCFQWRNISQVCLLNQAAAIYLQNFSFAWQGDSLSIFALLSPLLKSLGAWKTCLKVWLPVFDRVIHGWVSPMCGNSTGSLGAAASES